jgi:hypothetical protein
MHSIPGFWGSLAATPQVPGWSWASMYCHTSVSAGPDVAFARQVPVGNLNVNFTGNVNANFKSDVDMGIAIPQYVFATPVLGGQAAVALLMPLGHNRTSVDATLIGNLGLGFRVAQPVDHEIGARFQRRSLSSALVAQAAVIPRLPSYQGRASAIGKDNFSVDQSN